MSASRSARFEATTLTFAVGGGTGEYLDARGEILSAPAAGDAQRLTPLLG